MNNLRVIGHEEARSSMYLRLRRERPDWTPFEAAQVAVYWPGLSPLAGAPVNPLADAIARELCAALGDNGEAS